MTLEDLIEIMPPPAVPASAGDEHMWPKIELEVATALPPDYKRYINIYGSGNIGRFMMPFNPFSPNPHVNLLKQSDMKLDSLRQIREFDGKVLPYRIHPEPEGLFPWGITWNADFLLWHRLGDPEEWPVIVVASDWGIESFPERMTSFLARVMARQITSDIFPDNVPEGDPLFDPGDWPHSSD